MIYDCILFNDELHMLELRLAYLYDSVDRFVIGESSSTFSNQHKRLYFKENAAQFAKYKDKIVYLEIPAESQTDAWAGEFFQRNYLKTALTECHDDDLVIIADIDELPDIEQLKKKDALTGPCLVETPMYYYFFNLKTEIEWCRVLVSPYQYLKNFDIGDRLKYVDLNPTILKSDEVKLGWHFSYLFGRNIDLYVSKLKSFAHQELNTPYYLDKRRIETCLSLGIDFLERYSIYQPVDLEKEVPPALLKAIKDTLPIEAYLYKKPPLSFYFDPYHLKYYLKFVVKLKLRIFLNRFSKSK